MNSANGFTEVRNFVTITCTVGKEILNGANVSKLQLDEPTWTVRVLIELTMQPALLSFRCLVSGRAVGTTTASYRDIQELDQPLAAGEGSATYSTAASYREVDGVSQQSSRNDDPSRSASPASDTSVENGMIHRLSRDGVTQDTNQKPSTGARHGRMIHVRNPVSMTSSVDPNIPRPASTRPASTDPRTGLLSPPYRREHYSSRSAECLASGTWV